ncbi:uncharacterized protein [Oscarella lobularis]|uniref:uncharacterized protein n=1 Tax=Oscarella lobularis TaxID=121494 RepID=UPI003313D028
MENDDEKMSRPSTQLSPSFSAKAINTADAVWSALSQNRRHATPTLLQSPGHAEKRLLAARRASKANQRAEGIAESAASPRAVLCEGLRPGRKKDAAWPRDDRCAVRTINARRTYLDSATSSLVAAVKRLAHVPRKPDAMRCDVDEDVTRDDTPTRFCA